MYLLRQMTRVGVGGRGEPAAGLLQGLLLLDESQASSGVPVLKLASLTASAETLGFFLVMMKMLTCIQMHWSKNLRNTLSPGDKATTAIQLPDTLLALR